jgi:hypothetical protein
MVPTAKDTAKHEAGHVQEAVGGAADDVLGTAKEQVSDVASDVQHETRRLIGETRDQLGQQATQQRDQAVRGLRSLSDELRAMAQHGSGWGAQLARQGAGWTDRTVGFLDGRELTDILEDVRTMARRRPGRFLLGAAVAGVVAGRLTRAMAAGPPGTGDDRTPNHTANGAAPGAAAGAVGSGNGQLGGLTSGPSEGQDPLGQRRTGQDELHHPLAAGEPDGPASQDPTIAGSTGTHGQPTTSPSNPVSGTPTSPAGGPTPPTTRGGF